MKPEHLEDGFIRVKQYRQKQDKLTGDTVYDNDIIRSLLGHSVFCKNEYDILLWALCEYGLGIETLIEE